jgi:fructokinase
MDTPDLFETDTGPPPIYGCIEAGGTKFMLGLLCGPDEVRASMRIETRGPEETLAAALAFFTEHAPPKGYEAFGIGSFGPVDPDPISPRWGTIGETPKPGWRGTDMVTPFARTFDRPIGFDTDVNAAALAESLWGAAIDTPVSTYLTVGTGVGGGVVVAGKPLHGRQHPEMGHFLPARHPRDAFVGSCPYHGACLEGLASGTAIAARWGTSLNELPVGHEAHEIVAYYLGQAVIAQQAMLSPKRIVMGGGVMQVPGLIGRVREAAARIGNGYFCPSADYETLVVEPGLGPRSGLLGALALAMAAR